MLIIRKLMIFITLTLLPPFIIEFIFFWPPANTIAGIGSYLLILSVWAAIITFFSRVFGFDLDSLFVTDSTDEQTSFNMHAPTEGGRGLSSTERRLSTDELAAEFTARDNSVRKFIMALIPTIAKPELAKFTLSKGPEDLNAEIPLSGDKVIQIGRHPTLNNVVLSDKKISRVHAIIITEKDGFYIEDKDSANGTFVNKKRLSSSDRHQLHGGDIVNFGPIEYRFEFLEELTTDSLQNTEKLPPQQQKTIDGLSLS